MDQRDLHILIADSESHDQVEFTGQEDIGRAPVRKEIAVNEEDHAIAVEVEIGMRHRSEQRATGVVRTSNVGQAPRIDSRDTWVRLVVGGRLRAPG